MEVLRDSTAPSAQLTERDARELLLLASSNIATRRFALERLYVDPLSTSDDQSDGDQKELTEEEAKERDAQHFAVEDFDLWAAEFVSALVETLGLSPAERQAALVSLKQLPSSDDPGTAPLDLLSADVSVKTNASELILVAMLQGTGYDARERTLLRDTCFSGPSSLDLIPSTMPLLERRISLLLAEARSPLQPATPTSDKKSDSSAWTVKKAGLALAGGMAVAVGGVMAAPLVAGGLGTLLTGVGLGGSSLAGAAAGIAGNSGLVGALFGGLGAVRTKEIVDRAGAEVEDFEFIPLGEDSASSPSQFEPHNDSSITHPPSTNPLHTTIGLIGFLRSLPEITSPLSVLPALSTPHALRFDPPSFLAIGRIANDMVTSRALGYVKSEIIKRTLLATLYSSLWPLGLLKYASMLDNPFHHALSVAQKTGRKLAKTLMARKQGPGPVTLIGTSLGSTAVFECLLELDRRGAYGLVDSVVLCGSPVPTAKEKWRAARRAVSGRLVNARSGNDYLLAFLYRVLALSLGCAGVERVEVGGVEDLDCGDLVSWHGGWQDRLGRVLERAGIEVVLEEVQKQEAELGPEPEVEEGEEEVMDAFAPMGMEAGVLALQSSEEGVEIAENRKRAREEEEEEEEERKRVEIGEER